MRGCLPSSSSSATGAPTCTRARAAWGALPGGPAASCTRRCSPCRSIAGTAGSGDATIAGFLASVVRGLGPEEALTLAVAVGGCCVEAPDATSGVRTWDETVSRVKGGWPRRSVAIGETGWRAAANGVWAGPGDRA